MLPAVVWPLLLLRWLSISRLLSLIQRLSSQTVVINLLKGKVLMLPVVPGSFSCSFAPGYVSGLWLPRQGCGCHLWSFYWKLLCWLGIIVGESRIASGIHLMK